MFPDSPKHTVTRKATMGRQIIALSSLLSCTAKLKTIGDSYASSSTLDDGISTPLSALLVTSSCEQNSSYQACLKLNPLLKVHNTSLSLRSWRAWIMLPMKCPFCWAESSESDWCSPFSQGAHLEVDCMGSTQVHQQRASLPATNNERRFQSTMQFLQSNKADWKHTLWLEKPPQIMRYEGL